MGMFDHIQASPQNVVLATTRAFNADSDPRKVNLGVGAYRTEEGKPLVLQAVREAEEELLAELGAGGNKEYTPEDGPEELKALTQSLLFGDDCPAVGEGRIASAQTISGTGALRLAAEFVNSYLGSEAQEVWVSDPTWSCHNMVFAKAGLSLRTYPYYAPATKSLNFEGMMKALKEDAKPGSLVLLHACAHNPTGVDPTEEQWKQIADVMRERRLVPLLDSAYQGYASGSFDKDAFAVRLFMAQGFEFFVCQSFAKNLGLYGERVGLLHVVCGSREAARAVLSQLIQLIVPMYMTPPKHGADIVVKILGHPERREAWKRELEGMSDRILEMRAELREGLERKGTPGTWNHITDQIGMFSFTGLTPPQCDRLINEHHIYLLKSGRISMAGLNRGNMQYIVDCIDEVIRAAPA